MPTFDFHCTDCDSRFEFKRPFGSTETPECPTCGSTKTEKQISPPAIHFKGSGFYKTDTGAPAKPAEKPKNETETPKKTEDTAKTHNIDKNKKI